MNKDTILHLSTLAIWDLGKGSGRVSTFLPLKGQVKAGYNVKYITSNQNEKSGNNSGIDIKKIYVPGHDSRLYKKILLLPLTTLIFVLKGIAWSRKNKPGIIYSHTTELSLAAFILAKLLKAKYVLRLYGIGKGINHPLKPSCILLRIALKIKADAYILTNDGTNAEEVAKKLGVNPQKIHFLKNGINKTCPSTKDLDLKKRIAPNNELIILTVSRLSNSKHIDDIIRMMVPLSQKGIKFKLVIIGDGPERGVLDALVSTLHLKEYILFTGALKQSEVMAYDMIADIFISLNELSSMSNPVFEAMLAGCPGIALNRGTTKDLIQDGINGFLIENVSDLPETIERITGENLTHIGEKAHETIMSTLPTWEERIALEIEVLRKL